MKDHKDYILQKDWLNDGINQIGKKSWVTVYEINDSESQRHAMFSAFIPKNLISSVLKKYEWDVSIGFGLPSIDIVNERGVPEVEYKTIYQDNMIFPLVIVRDFHGAKSSYIEILEELRLFHNLFHDTAKNIFIKFLETGDEEEIIRITENKVQIRLKELKQFLTFREVYLAIYLEVFRYSPLDISNFSVDDTKHSATGAFMNFDFYLTQYDENEVNKNILSCLRGKKLIQQMPLEKIAMYPFAYEREYEEFIIGIDENGNEIVFSSNVDGLANFFGKNKGKPQYLTPVFFKRETLKKYYQNTDKYNISDGYLNCSGYWSLRIDNNNENYVTAYLGDLGGLPYNEQKYWRTYNIIPDGKISEVAYQRDMLGEFADPEEASLLFKSKFTNFQSIWFDKYNWHLFKPLNKEDMHHIDSLRIPLNSTQSEFDEQILSLTKILIDSLNEAKVNSAITEKLDAKVKGISKFEKYLEQECVNNYSYIISFMRDLQQIRSTSAAHRKSRNYDKKMNSLNIDLNDLPKSFKELLEKAIHSISILEDRFL